MWFSAILSFQSLPATRRFLSLAAASVILLGNSPQAESMPLTVGFNGQLNVSGQ